MATNLKISVAGNGLVERSKQQQRDARAGRLTREAITKDAESNREEILRATAATPELSRALTTARPIDTETAPFLRVNRPAATRIPDNAFLVVTNLNFVYPDLSNTHRVYITDPSGNVSTLSGLLDSSMVDFMNRTYLFLPRGRTLDDFKRSIPYSYIFATLDTHYTPTPEERPRAVTFIEPIFSLTPFRPARGTPYTIALTGDVPSLTGNAGAVMAGYFNEPTYYIAEWLTGWDYYDPIITYNIRWGATNYDLDYLYPPDYPL